MKSNADTMCCKSEKTSVHVKKFVEKKTQGAPLLFKVGVKVHLFVAFHSHMHKMGSHIIFQTPGL